MSLYGSAVTVTPTLTFFDDTTAPSGTVRLNEWSRFVKIKNSSICARFSPKQARFPATNFIRQLFPVRYANCMDNHSCICSVIDFYREKRPQHRETWRNCRLRPGNGSGRTFPDQERSVGLDAWRRCWKWQYCSPEYCSRSRCWLPWSYGRPREARRKPSGVVRRWLLPCMAIGLFKKTNQLTWETFHKIISGKSF